MDHVMLGPDVIVCLSLLFHLWFRRSHGSIAKKLRWSLILLIPLFGWFAYGALYGSGGRPRNRNRSVLPSKLCFGRNQRCGPRIEARN